MWNQFKVWLADKLDPETREEFDTLVDEIEAMSEELKELIDENASFAKEVKELRIDQATQEPVSADPWCYERTALQADVVKNLLFASAHAGVWVSLTQAEKTAKIAESVANSVYPQLKPLE